MTSFLTKGGGHLTSSASSSKITAGAQGKHPLGKHPSLLLLPLPSSQHLLQHLHSHHSHSSLPPHQPSHSLAQNTMSKHPSQMITHIIPSHLMACTHIPPSEPALPVPTQPRTLKPSPRPWLDLMPLSGKSLAKTRRGLSSPWEYMRWCHAQRKGR